jgi:penicillin-binding protein 1A
MIVRVFAITTIFIVVVMGAGLGFSLAETANIKNEENFQRFVPALPTKILDMNGTVITEFSADEKRELITLNALPRHLIDAVLTREDAEFYSHKGFSVRGIVRAAVGQITGRNRGGGSTITQQLAGALGYVDRTEISIARKIKEIWWAVQLERRFTKDEILEMYLNYTFMGAGTYGVEAASKYYFGHSARDITLAEAAVLVVQLSAPTRYNPLDNPNVAMERQRQVLDRMVERGHATKEEAQSSFDEYWANYDYTRASTTAYYHREDKAPWFSEYVRRELDGLMYGTRDYYRDGYTVYTTLDLRHQEAAVNYMNQGIAKANALFAESQRSRLITAERTWAPIVNLLTLCFGLDEIHNMSGEQIKEKAQARYTKVINPVVDMAALMFGISELKPLTNTAFADLKGVMEQNVVEGALISIENETGYITAIVGGSKFDESNQLIRATQAKVMPGSAFKPLYYSAAIDSKRFNPSSLLYDIPTVFGSDENGSFYVPYNYNGAWNGPILLYSALARSLNIPALKILDAVGFDAAIDRSAALLGITSLEEKRKTFPRVYPLGLGIISVSPVQMARAYAIFGNQGRAVTPIAIRSIEDRNGRVVIDPEREVRFNQRRMGNAMQVVSPQNAYVMTGLLKKTVEMTGGLLVGQRQKFIFADENGRRYSIPAAGKTGTAQNWSDAWAIGYTPYYTTAIWFGFDKPGNSLGFNVTGSTLAGPVWGDYMRDIHQGLPAKDFVRPSSGITDVTVCAKSGLLPTSACNEGMVTLPFFADARPVQYCDLHGGSKFTDEVNLRSIFQNTISLDEDTLLGSLTMPVLPQEFMIDPGPNRRDTETANPQREGESPLDASQPPQSGGAGTAGGPDAAAAGANSASAVDGASGAGGAGNANGGSNANNEGREEGAAVPDYGLEFPDFNPLLE